LIHLTRRYHFAASHRLHSGHFSDAENRDLYGKCNHPFGHGHDYVLEVCVAGPLNPGTGQVINPRKLDKLVQESILKDFEHRNLNLDVPEFGDLVPTSENIVFVIRERLERNWGAAFPGAWPRLERIRLEETQRNVIELNI